MHVLMLLDDGLAEDSAHVKDAIEHSNYHVTSTTTDRKDDDVEAVIVVTAYGGGHAKEWWRRESKAPLFYVYSF